MITERIDWNIRQSFGQWFATHLPSGKALTARRLAHLMSKINDWEQA